MMGISRDRHRRLKNNGFKFHHMAELSSNLIYFEISFPTGRLKSDTRKEYNSVSRRKGMAKKPQQHHHYRPRSRNISVYAIKNAGFTIVKKDGSIIRVSPKAKIDKSALQHVSPDRKEIIRSGVRRKYSSLSIDELNKIYLQNMEAALKIYNDPEISSPSYELSLKKKANVKLRITFACLDTDGSIVLKIKDRRYGSTVYMKTINNVPLYNSVAHTAQYYPFRKLLDATTKLPECRDILNLIYEAGITRRPFNLLVESVRNSYLVAIGDYFIFLEHFKRTAEVNHILFGCPYPEQKASEVKQPTPAFPKPSGKTIPSNDVIRNGDKIYCKLSSIIIVENTFKCLNKGHQMIGVTLEVLIKNVNGSTPFTKDLKAYYCKQCKKVFMYTNEFYEIYNLIKDNRYQVFNCFLYGGKKVGYKTTTDMWAAESVLKKAGYEVNQQSSLSQEQRIKILIALNVRGVSYHRIVSYLNTFIDINGSVTNRDMNRAVRCWKSDMEILRALYDNRIVR